MTLSSKAVLIVDDHSIVRRGLRELLYEQSSCYLTIVDEAATLAEARLLLTNQAYGLLLLDISLPDGNGLDLLRELQQIRPHLPVLIISMYAENQFAMQAFESGAAGYITKESAAKELCIAMERVLSGGRYVSPDFSETLLQGHPQPPCALLSSRERQVADLLVEGASIKLIAFELEVSEKTVSTYRSRLLEKLGLHSNSELVAYYIKHGLKQI